MTKDQEIDFSVDLLQHITWQFEKAERLKSLVTSKNDWYKNNHTDFWNDWVSNVFDITTANSFGLSVWAKILDFPLFGEVEESPLDYPAFGFNDFGLNFDNGNFATDSRGVFSLDLDSKRILLRLKYSKITTRSSITEVNKMLDDVIGIDEIYVVDNFNMTITYTLISDRVKGLRYLFESFDLLPRACGVQILFNEI